jgi:hypothetical protein
MMDEVQNEETSTIIKVKLSCYAMQVLRGRGGIAPTHY